MSVAAGRGRPTVSAATGSSARGQLLAELLLVEQELRSEDGRPPLLKDYRGRFAGDARMQQILEQFFADNSGRSAHSNNHAADTVALSRGNQQTELPRRIARYRIRRLLGQGGLGRVYLGYDPELDRPVAVKVPKLDLLGDQQQIELYRQEARTAAQLDHPRIVSVYDVGSTDVYPCYVVCKYVEGQDLAEKLKTERLDCYRGQSWWPWSVKRCTTRTNRASCIET